MSGTKVNIIVSVCLAVCLAVLVVAHIDLRQETARLRRTVRLVSLTTNDTSDVSYEIEQINSRVSKIEDRVDEIDSEARHKVSHADFEDLKREVSGLEDSVLSARSRISDFADSSDIVQRYELDQETLDLERRIEAIEKTLGRRY